MREKSNEEISIKNYVSIKKNNVIVEKLKNKFSSTILSRFGSVLFILSFHL